MLGHGGTVIRLLVVDDSPDFRGSVRRHLTDDPAVSVIGEVDNGTDALRAVERLRPDVVLLDLFMPPPDGFIVLRLIKVLFQPVKVVVMTSDGSEVVRQRCGALMADAVIDKANASTLLLPTLRRVGAATGAGGMS